MDISSDSHLLVSGSADKNIKIWGLDFGDCHRSLFAHGDSVMQVAFVHNTHYVFTVGAFESHVAAVLLCKAQNTLCICSTADMLCSWNILDTSSTSCCSTYPLTLCPPWALVKFGAGPLQLVSCFLQRWTCQDVKGVSFKFLQLVLCSLPSPVCTS